REQDPVQAGVARRAAGRFECDYSRNVRDGLLKSFGEVVRRFCRQQTRIRFTEIGEKSHAYLESSSHRGFTGIDQRSRAASGRISDVRVRCDADGATVEYVQRAPVHY